MAKLDDHGHIKQVKRSTPLNPGRRSSGSRKKRCKIVSLPDGRGGLEERRFDTESEQELFRLLKPPFITHENQNPFERYYNDPSNIEDASGYQSCASSRCRTDEKPTKYRSLRYLLDIGEAREEQAPTYDPLRYLENEDGNEY